MNNITDSKVTYLATRNFDNLKASSKKLSSYIIEGQLQETEALANVKELLGVLRDANTTIRWTMLH